MEKFSQIVYKRPDIQELSQKIREFTEEFPKAKDYSQARDLFLALEKAQIDLDTMNTVADIRNTIDTADPFYEQEMEFYEKAIPQIQVEMKEVSQVILQSPFVQDFEKEFGNIYIKNLKNQIRFANEENVANRVEENRLTRQYAKASAVCTTTFHGEEVNFYGLLKYMESKDRSVRREAFNAWANLYASVAGELDNIYDQLVRVRVKMAGVLGFKDYIEMAYHYNGRFDYGREEVANFRRQIVEHIVPVCQKLYDQQRRRLGIDHLYYYDEALVFPEGNAVPEGNSHELVAKAKKMYGELSKETGEFFDFMVENQLFDLETKPGKRQGGYCTFLSKYKAPFIFSNFNGTSADVDVLTHEAGHAFEAYSASRIFPLTEQVWSTAEISEIHSMSMEYFTHPWMELFFGEKADQYRYAHLVSSLCCIPYMACVDEFQHRVFEEMADNAAQRRKIWRELEKKYMPWRAYDGNEFLEGGGFWMQKQHIFLFPFYYIDYALAQMGAFEFYGRMKQDPEKAWEGYYKFCCAGGSKGYFDLLKVGGLSNPFDDHTVERVMDLISEDLRLNG